MKYFYLVSFVGGLAIGALVTAAWFLGTPEFPAAYAPGSPATTTPNVRIGNASGAVAVADQAAGDTVAIESITVPPPGVWVAVREVGQDGTLGNVLGAARARGPVSGFAIPLLRPTVAGAAYAVLLYRDDAGGAFDPAQNSVYVDFDTGERVVAYFKAQ